MPRLTPTGRKLHKGRPAGAARGVFRKVGELLRRPKRLSKSDTKSERAEKWERRKGPRLDPTKDPGSPQAYRLDKARKVHAPDGVFPNGVPSHWKREEIEQVASDVRTSLATRRNEPFIFGREDGPHREQIRRQEDFLKLLERALESR